MQRRPGERWDCEACGEPLIGALTVNGKVSPITVEPKANGNVWLGRSRSRWAWDGERWSEMDGPIAQRVTVCAVLAGPLLDQLREKNVGLHLNHFADCPNAGRFRTESKE